MFETGKHPAPARTASAPVLCATANHHQHQHPAAMLGRTLDTGVVASQMQGLPAAVREGCRATSARPSSLPAFAAPPPAARTTGSGPPDRVSLPLLRWARTGAFQKQRSPPGSRRRRSALASAPLVGAASPCRKGWGVGGEGGLPGRRGGGGRTWCSLERTQDRMM